MTHTPTNAAGVDLKVITQERVIWLDSQIAGREFISGQRPTPADILLFAFLDFFVGVQWPLNENNKNIMAWCGRMLARA